MAFGNRVDMIRDLCFFTLEVEDVNHGIQSPNRLSLVQFIIEFKYKDTKM